MRGFCFPGVRFVSTKHASFWDRQEGRQPAWAQNPPLALNTGDLRPLSSPVKWRGYGKLLGEGLTQRRPRVSLRRCASSRLLPTWPLVTAASHLPELTLGVPGDMTQSRVREGGGRLAFLAGPHVLREAGCLQDEESHLEFYKQESSCAFVWRVPSVFPEPETKS